MRELLPSGFGEANTTVKRNSHFTWCLPFLFFPSKSKVVEPLQGGCYPSDNTAGSMLYLFDKIVVGRFFKTSWV